MQPTKSDAQQQNTTAPAAAPPPLPPDPPASLEAAKPAPSKSERAKAKALAALKWTKAFCLKHFLPLCFLVATAISLAAPAPGKAVGSVTVRPCPVLLPFF